MILVDPLIAGPSALLVLGGFRTVEHRSEAIQAHGVIPVGARRVVAAGVGVGELTCGAAGLVGSVVGGTASTIVVPAGLAYVVFAVYGVLAIRSDRAIESTPCGCVGPSTRLSGATVARPVVAMALVAIGAITSFSDMPALYAIGPVAVITAALFFGPWIVTQ